MLDRGAGFDAYARCPKCKHPLFAIRVVGRRRLLICKTKWCNYEDASYG